MQLFWLGWPIFRVVAMRYRYRYSGYENVTRKGPLLVVSNHISRKDPVGIGLALKRSVRFMAKKETFDPRNSFLECLMVRLFGAFPVDRERPGPESIRRTLSFLDDGDAVGIFPEGTRFDDHKLHPFEAGAAYFAWKSGAPILPIGITEDKGHDYHIRIGVPFRVPDTRGRPHDVLPEINRLIRDKIWDLLPDDWELMDESAGDAAEATQPSSSSEAVS